LELVLFACGLKVVENRHNARKLFIELEHEQQVHHSLMDEKARLKLEISNLEQIRQVEVRAKEGHRGHFDRALEAHRTLLLEELRIKTELEPADANTKRNETQKLQTHIRLPEASGSD